MVSMQTSSTSFFAHNSPCILYFTILLSVPISTVSSTPLLVKSPYGLSGPLGQCLSGVFHSIKQLITLGVFLLLCGWDAIQSQDYLSIKFASTYIYTWVERDLVRVKFLKNTRQCPQPGLKPGRPDPESSALTLRPPCPDTITLILCIPVSIHCKLLLKFTPTS